MCNCTDLDGPECLSEKIRKARKAHRCCECNRYIHPGQRYQYVSGIWDGAPDSFRTCLRCLRLREAQTVIECFPAFTTLRDTIRECMYFEPDYLPKLRKQLRITPVKGSR